MNRLILLSIIFIPFFSNLYFPEKVSSVEINCNSPVWKNKDRCKDKTVVKKKKKKRGPELLTTTGEIKYPFTLEKIGMLDPSSGKTIPVKLFSENKDFIEIIPKNGEKSNIDSESILQWSVGDYSEVKFSGVEALASGGGFAAGAIIAGGPAAPFLLLASPFVGMMSGNVAYPQWRVLVRELGDDGREKQILLQAVNEQNAFAIRSLVSKASGLKAGVTKSSGEIDILREKKLTKLENESLILENELLAAYSKGEVCSKDSENNKVMRYDEIKTLINGLRRSLRIEETFKNICSS